MKRLYIYILAAAGLALAGLIPVGGHDAAELLPAQVLEVWQEDGRVQLLCDNGAEGSGRSFEAAVADMEQRAAGVLFLDTAEQILFRADAWETLGQAALSQKLRPAAKIYLCTGQLPDAGAAVPFLQAHSGSVTLGDARAAILAGERVQAPRLRTGEGGMTVAQ